MNTDMLSSANHIVMIHRELLHPHPDNPRKDLGDLSELRDSILEHGIMQNLTIVPDGKDYKILIGHRRFAASEGILEDLPCVIVKGLSDREQLGIMLVENMQRSDLTYMEQAHGFQMMMDLGDTIETIAEKTGFSKSTVKHRLAINDINKEILAEVEKSFQLTITDFIELEKIKDVDRRNELLSTCDSSEELKRAVEDELEEEKEQEEFNYYKKFFDEAGWIDETEKNKWFYYGDGFNPLKNALDRIDISSERIPEDELKDLISKAKGEIHYGMAYSCIMVRRYKQTKANKNEEEAEKKRKATEALKRKNKAALREIRSEICDAYMDFILNSKVEFKTAQQELSFFYCFLDLCRDISATVANLDEEKIKYQLMDKVSLKKYDQWDTHHLKDFANWTPLFQLLANIWWSLASSYNYFEDYDCRPNMDRLKAHQTFCDLLRDLDGFHIKEEWKAVLDGTSDLYIKEDK